MAISVRTLRSRIVFVAVAVALVGVVTQGVGLVAQSRRDFDVVAHKYGFRVNGSASSEIHVTQNDLVHINFSTDDIPHSFTVRDDHGSAYRINRKAEPGKPVVCDFRADTPGRFTYYCSLTIDERCKGMEGTLIVDKAN